MKTKQLKCKSAQNNHDYMQYKLHTTQQYKSKFKLAYQTKYEQNNVIYLKLKSQKLVNSIFAKIFSCKPKKIKTQGQQAQSYHYLSPNKKREVKSVIDNSRRRYSLRDEQSIQQSTKKLTFMNSMMKNFQKSTDANKKRINLLNKFNTTVKRYQQKLPKDPAQQTRQSIECYEQLVNLCKQDSLPKKKNNQSFYQKYDEIMRFQPPQISTDIKNMYLLKRKKQTIRSVIKCKNNI